MTLGSFRRFLVSNALPTRTAPGNPPDVPVVSGLLLDLSSPPRRFLVVKLAKAKSNRMKQWQKWKGIMVFHRIFVPSSKDGSIDLTSVATLVAGCW